MRSNRKNSNCIRSDESVWRLRNAIVEQAATDYIAANNDLRKMQSEANEVYWEYGSYGSGVLWNEKRDEKYINSKNTKREVRDFFLGEWFTMLCDSDGRFMLEELDKIEGVKYKVCTNGSED